MFKHRRNIKLKLLAHNIGFVLTALHYHCKSSQLQKIAKIFAFARHVFLQFIISSAKVGLASVFLALSFSRIPDYVETSKKHLLSLRFNFNSTKKRASRASALRADGFFHIRGLVLTPGTSPTHWIQPRRPLGPVPPLPFDY